MVMRISFLQLPLDWAGVTADHMRESHVLLGGGKEPWPNLVARSNDFGTITGLSLIYTITSTLKVITLCLLAYRLSLL